MDAGRVLVIYGTSYGQTAKIARRIGDVLQRAGLAVELCDAARGRPTLGPEQYSAIVVGASLIARGIQPSVQRFVRQNLVALNAGVSAFYLVSASAGSSKEKGRRAAQRILDGFLAAAGWKPRLSASIAGAINYTKYWFLLRWYMKRASAMNGGDTDTSRDHEYTDWAQVERFAADIASLAQRSEAGAPDTEAAGAR